MAERLNAAVLKTAEGASPPGVQIPLLPPESFCLQRIFCLTVWMECPTRDLSKEMVPETKPKEFKMSENLLPGVKVVALVKEKDKEEGCDRYFPAFGEIASIKGDFAAVVFSGSSHRQKTPVRDIMALDGYVDWIKRHLDPSCEEERWALKNWPCLEGVRLYAQKRGKKIFWRPVVVLPEDAPMEMCIDDLPVVEAGYMYGEEREMHGEMISFIDKDRLFLPE